MSVTNQEAAYIAERVGQICRDQPHESLSILVITPKSATQSYYEDTKFIVWATTVGAADSQTLGVSIQ